MAPPSPSTGHSGGRLIAAAARDPTRDFDPPVNVSSPPPRAKRYQSDGEVIGRGGMGEIKLVTDRRIGRAVAMKVLRDGCKARFLREARVQGQLEHPAIVPLYDAGVDSEGQLYFTMRRVRGATLGTILGRLVAGDITTRAANTRHKLLVAFGQVCLAIDYAHSRGVIHRDLKPANIMLGSFGEVYVLDWGVAKVSGDDAIDEPVSHVELGDLTGHGECLGTAGYMSPEQVAGEPIDARSDVYTLGVILYELLALERLHAGSSEARLASTMIAIDVAKRMRCAVRARHVPHELVAIVQDALHVEPVRRYPSARALAEAIEDYLASH